MKQPIIAVDMDGVLIEYNRSKVVPALQAAGFDITYDEITRFNYEELLGPEGAKVALSIINSEEVYDGLDAEPGALKGLEALRKIGRVIILTYALTNMARVKLTWLKEHGIDFADIVYARDKRLVQADILIDDAVHNIEPWLATGRPAVLFDRPWNRYWERTDLAPRVFRWDEVPAAVQQQLEEHEKIETVLEEAGRIVDRGARQQDYGHPSENYAALAAMVNALLGRKLKEPVDPMDTLRFMVGLKLVRDANRSKRDNWTDTAGYARVAERVAAALGLWGPGQAAP